MARKSRKAIAAESEIASVASCRAAIYVRLSVEDKQSGTASIETQQLIIAQFLERNPDIGVYHNYIDNGATGTNFRRPGFQQMLSDIEAGLVNCVIVKDLSRLGRNTIDTGYYIEQYFRIRKIRFIAVNENYDTFARQDGSADILIPLRNMINEAYSLDIGRKIRASQRQMMKDGKYVGARPPYGYLKASDDCHRLVIDPATAPVVRQIFEWASEGAGLNTIAVRLNEAGYQTPSHYKYGLGLVSGKMLGNGMWQTRVVSALLRNEIYTGDMVQGRSKTIDHKQIAMPPDEWIVVRGTHEAIVSHALFATVQRILEETSQKSKTHPTKPYTPNIFKGKIFCASCGGGLHRQKHPRKKGPDRYEFHCLTRSRVNHSACPGVMIYEDKLLSAITDILLENLDVVLGRYALCIEASPEREACCAEMKEKIAVKQRERTRLFELNRSLYENLTLGAIDKDDYFLLRERYTAQISQADDEIQRFNEGLARLDEQLKRYRSLKKEAWSVRKDRVLTAELIDRLIERIEVASDKHRIQSYAWQSYARRIANAWRLVMLYDPSDAGGRAVYWHLCYWKARRAGSRR